MYPCILFLVFYVRYSTLIHLPTLRFHCVGGCWGRTQDCSDFGICSQTLARSHPFVFISLPAILANAYYALRLFIMVTDKKTPAAFFLNKWCISTDTQTLFYIETVTLVQHVDWLGRLPSKLKCKVNQLFHLIQIIGPSCESVSDAKKILFARELWGGEIMLGWLTFHNCTVTWGKRLIQEVLCLIHSKLPLIHTRLPFIYKRQCLIHTKYVTSHPH